MNHTLEIKGLRPIEECKVECAPFMAFTGKQASGKSTIAKALYFFRTIKDDIVKLAERRALSHPMIMDDSAAGALSGLPRMSLRRSLEHALRSKFLGIFGSSFSMRHDMQLSYFYTDNCYIRVSLKSGDSVPTPNYVWIEMSDDLYSFLRAADNALTPQIDSLSTQKQDLQERLRALFDDPYSVVFIPAGRSMLTVLSEQLLYIYSTMEDNQKRALDYCTREYVERILKLKPEFSEGLDGLLMQSAYERIPAARSTLRTAKQLIDQILGGSYQTVNGEERLMIDETQYVKINYSSSGQQESVWILNLLFYYLLQDKPILFIVEEPESHLFPESQKYITELMTLVSNQGHSFIVTTHSPYVLGTMNNLLYASYVEGFDRQAAEAIIPGIFWLDGSSFDAWFVRDGHVESGMLEDPPQIASEKIDEISHTVNSDFDKLLEIELKVREGDDSVAAG